MVDAMNGERALRMNDAIIIGDLDAPEYVEVLDSELVCGFALNAPRVSADKWRQVKAPLRKCLEELTSHPVSEKKEGKAIFFNETELTGKPFRPNGRDGKSEPYAHRSKRHVTSVTALALDIDGTDKIERVTQRLVELGLFGIAYTTDSHSEKASPDGDYFRVIIPLEKPFRVSEHGGNVNVAAKRWEAKYLGFCEQVLGCTDVDASGAKFAQMMHTPRRP